MQRTAFAVLFMLAGVGAQKNFAKDADKAFANDAYYSLSVVGLVGDKPGAPVEVATFKGVDGLSAELEVIEFQDGDDTFLRKRPGRAKFGNITLKRGLMSTTGFRRWSSLIHKGSRNHKDTSFKFTAILTQKSHTSDFQRSWNLFGCWPKQWKVNGFEDGEGIAMEEMTFVVDTFKIA